MSRDDVVGELPYFFATLVLKFFILAPRFPALGGIYRQPIFIVLKQITGNGNQSFGGFDENGYAPIVVSGRVENHNIFVYDVLLLKELQEMIAFNDVVAADKGSVGKQVHVADVVYVRVRQDDKINVFRREFLRFQLFEDQRFIGGDPQIHHTVFLRSDKSNGSTRPLARVPLPPGVTGFKDANGCGVWGHTDWIIASAPSQ